MGQVAAVKAPVHLSPLAENKGNNLMWIKPEEVGEMMVFFDPHCLLGIDVAESDGNLDTTKQIRGLFFLAKSMEVVISCPGQRPSLG